MRELVRTTDPVLLSWLMALLTDAGIPTFLLDSHTSVLEGSVGAIPRRLMVAADDFDAARRLVAQSEATPAEATPAEATPAEATGAEATRAGAIAVEAMPGPADERA